MSSVVGAAATALAAAALLGSAGAVQRHATLTVPTYGAGDPRLLAALTRQPWWWIGTAASVVGLGLQVAALTLGPIIVEQSVMISSVVFTTVAEGLMTGHRPRGRTWSGVGLTGLGLVGLLAALSPTAGTGTVPSGGSTLAVAVGCLVIMLAAVTWSRTSAPSGSGAGRVLALAVATGLGYGITAVALKTVGTQLTTSLAGPLQHPALYVALVLGPAAILLSQTALQQGRLATAVVSVILVVDPLVGLVAGLFWFGETVDLGTDAVVCAIVLLAGVVLTQRDARHTDPARTTPASRQADLTPAR